MFGLTSEARFRVRHIAEDFEAALVLEITGGTAGKAEWKVYRTGLHRLKLKARNLPLDDGETVEAVVAGHSLGQLVVARGRARLDLDEERDEIVPQIRNLDSLILRTGDGTIVAKGFFRPD